jgi:DNA-binding XRE family transcriptional regulator
MAAVDLGEKIGVSEQRVFDIERGRYRPRRDEAMTWAAALRMRPEAAFPEMFEPKGGGRD